ncbi:MAG TPA: biotin--[acetyl-CoA-carboxylase] ligase [Candidatus Elarobacter sp.]|jgi:BirA family biotin operon repressor/biotin-[acetyl-CoA-carboxylase] ligase|nr:biotin--[acetyl-CoA-carboxylase] ligase [Candidatus Elarobacter sp.]
MTVASPWDAVAHAHDVVGSTNDEAKALARAGAPHGTVVSARAQSAGRGRIGRSWASPPGNLYCSVVLRPTVAFARVAELGFVAALAVGDVVEARIARGTVSLKWPNDVLVDGAKVAGILLECEAADGSAPWVVAGIGLNVATAPSGLPYPVASLRAQGASIDAPAALDDLLDALRSRLDEWEGDGFARVRVAWLERALRRDGPIRVRSGERELIGRLADLDADGALIVQTAAGRERVVAGDVTPAGG